MRCSESYQHEAEWNSSGHWEQTAWLEPAIALRQPLAELQGAGARAALAALLYSGPGGPARVRVHYRSRAAAAVRLGITIAEAKPEQAAGLDLLPKESALLIG